ncbi:MAG TPA: helix-turn-helix domain-containing protein [Pyrinomonadaceae bacterium]
MNSRREQIEDLADYVRRVRYEKGLSQRDVEVRSGGGISKGYIGQIETREVLGHSVTPQKLQALAAGLGISEDELFAVARGVSSAGDLSLEEVRLLHFYRSIPPGRRADAIGYLEMLFKMYGANGQPEGVGKRGPQPGKVYDAVAGIPKSVKRARKSSSKKPKR